MTKHVPWQNFVDFFCLQFLYFLHAHQQNELAEVCVDVIKIVQQRNVKTRFKLMKKRSERRKHCALAVVRRFQNFRPAADPLPGAQDGQNLISWRWSLPLPTNSVW